MEINRDITIVGVVYATQGSVSVAEMTLVGVAAVSDTEFGGAGTVTGQTLVKDGGPEVPTRARVRLLRARDGLLARETWSDPVTGAYSFAGLDTAQQFVALAQRPDGAYEPVAGGPLTPQVP